MLSAPPVCTPVQATQPYVSLNPSAGRIYCVRWPRRDRREAKHCYFRRRPDALAFAGRLRGRGYPVAVFVSDVEWTEVPL
jgi:hypothetical protein